MCLHCIKYDILTIRTPMNGDSVYPPTQSPFESKMLGKTQP